MGHDHDHGVGLARAGERHRGRLAIAFGLTFGFFFVQAVTGVIANSLALLSDARSHAHRRDRPRDGPRCHSTRLSIRRQRRGAGRRRTRSGSTGSRFWLRSSTRCCCSVVAIWVLYEAAQRVFDDPEVLGVPMLIVAIIGLAIKRRRLPAAAGGVEGVVERRGRIPRGPRRHDRLRRRHHRCRAAPSVRLDLDRPRDRCSDRPVDPAPHVPPRTPRRANLAPGRSGTRRRRHARDRPRRHRGRRRRPRRARLDAHLGDGRRVGAPRHRCGHRFTSRAGPGRANSSRAAMGSITAPSRSSPTTTTVATRSHGDPAIALSSARPD